MDWFLKRISEGSTWAGLAAVILGIGQVGKINEAPVIADAVGQVGAAVGAGIDPVTAIVTAGAGAVAVFLRDKGGE